MIILLWSLMITVYGIALTRILFSNRWWVILNSLVVIIQTIISLLYFFDKIEIQILCNVAGAALGWWAFWMAVKFFFQWQSFHFLLKKYEEEENLILNEISDYYLTNKIEKDVDIKKINSDLEYLLENFNKQHNLIKKTKQIWLRIFLFWLLGWILSGVGVLLLR